MPTYKKENAGVPGNSLASRALVERTLVRCGLAVHQIQRDLEKDEDFDNVLKSIRFATKFGAAGEWLAIVTRDSPHGPQVAFHAGMALPDTLEGLANKLRNGTLKWRPDEYAK